jgi:transposase InsO family protein
MPPLRVIKHNYKTAKHPTSFSGLHRLKNFYNISDKEAKRTLSKINSYSLHRETKKPKYRNPYFVYEKREQVQIDLIEISALHKSNFGVKYILTAIDLFTKFLVCVPMKSKDANSSKNAVYAMLQKMTPYPKKIMSDRGTEFTNREVKNLFREKNIEHILPESDMKCVVVERVNKTIQSKIYHYMTAHSTDRYILALQDLVRSYNNSIHQSIQMTPNDAENPFNHLKVLDRLNEHYTDIFEKKKSAKFKIGDIVRISMIKTKFHRSYKEQQKENFYEIIRINTKMPIPLFYLKDCEDLEEISGGFYSNELTLVDLDEWDIEKELKKGTGKNKNKILVKWRGFHKNYNSWEPEEFIINLRERSN